MPFSARSFTGPHTGTGLYARGPIPGTGLCQSGMVILLEHSHISFVFVSRSRKFVIFVICDGPEAVISLSVEVKNV